MSNGVFSGFIEGENPGARKFQIYIGRTSFDLYVATAAGTAYPGGIDLGSDWHVLRHTNTALNARSYVYLDDMYLGQTDGTGYGVNTLDFLRAMGDDNSKCGGTVEYDYVRWADGVYSATDPASNPITLEGPACNPGDANNDDVVSADDYGEVQLRFGDTGAVGILGDANCDGVVSADDYGSVQLNFGAVYSMGGTPVPEPATLGLLVLGGLALIRCRKSSNIA